MDGVAPQVNAGSAAGPPQPVGLLWVTFLQNGGAAATAKAASYMQQMLVSSGSARQHNPELPLALATNLRTNRSDLATRFDYIIRLGPKQANSKPPSSGRRLSALLRKAKMQSGHQSLWLVRLMALEASPFELTLEVDASATFCSSQLHALLLTEHRLSRLDFAVNFESTPLIRESTFGSQPPNQVESILPHNFAMLLRRGPGLSQLMRLWRAWMQRVGDDQYALRYVLLDLAHLKYRSCAMMRSNLSKRQCIPVRVWRLKETVLGMKYADKTRGGGKWLWPRYSRPIAGAVQVLHSYAKSATKNGSTMCALLNAQQADVRMILRPSHKSAYVTVRTRNGCRHLLANSTHQSEQPARKLCSLLPAKLQRAGAISELAEPLDDFWRLIQGIYHQDSAPSNRARLRDRRDPSMRDTTSILGGLFGRATRASSADRQRHRHRGAGLGSNPQWNA